MVCYVLLRFVFLLKSKNEYRHTLQLLLPKAFVTQKACMIPPIQRPTMHKMMLTIASHPSPRSKITATGGNSTHKIIEHNLFTILNVCTI